jgi:DNA-binding beta-propeller fold protein YncE
VVAESGAGVVTLVDLDRWQVTATVPVGAEPDAVAVARGGTLALVASLGADTVTPIDLESGVAGTPIDVGVPPTGLAVSGAPAPGSSPASDPEGTAWVAGGGVLVPIDLATLQAGDPVPAGGPAEAVAVSGRGRYAWVADAGGRVSEIDLRSARVVRSVSVGGRPTAIAIVAR